VAKPASASHNIQTAKVSDVTFKHILLPVWLAAIKYRARTYRFVVNGRTGSVSGETRTLFHVKITFAVILGLIGPPGSSDFLWRCKK